jgi:hypothetical protein
MMDEQEFMKSTSANLEAFIGDLVKKTVADRKIPAVHNPMEKVEELAKIVQEIHGALVGNEYIKGDGLFNKVDTLRIKMDSFIEGQKEINKRIKDPKGLEEYISGIIEKKTKEFIGKVGKRWFWILGSLSAAMPFMEWVLPVIIKIVKAAMAQV